MGVETTCRVSAELKVLLETDEIIVRGRVHDASAMVFLGVERDRDLPRIATVAAKLPPKAALWVIHPKGKDGVADTAIFAVAKQAGLTYTKVARFSATHTAERLNRPGTGRSAGR